MLRKWIYLPVNCNKWKSIFWLYCGHKDISFVNFSPTKISKHPQALRFFESESVVTDWYRGQLSNALSVINQMDVSFVMYYAPWDAESQYVRREFEKTAVIMKDRVSSYHFFRENFN